MFTPAAASRSTSARLCGSSAKARTDAATTGPMSGTVCSASTGASSIRVHRPEVARQRGRRLLADVPDAERVDQPRQIVRLAALDLSKTFGRPCPSLRGHGTLGRGSRGATTRFSSCAAVEVIEVGEVADETLLDQLIDQRLAEPLDVHRAARRSARGCAAAAPGTTCSRSARRLPLRRAAARCRTPGSRSASPTARESGGPQAQDRRDDLRDDVAGLLDHDAYRPRGCPCARRPRRCAASPSRSSSRRANTGSSTAYGVTAPVRPTLTSICSRLVCACCAGNLNAVAQRGNFAVVPSRSRSARSSTLMTTPSVSNSSVCRVVGPFLAEGDHRVDALAPPPVRFDRQTPLRACAVERLGCGRARSGSGRRRLTAGMNTASRASPRDGSNPHRARRGVARVREERLPAPSRSRLMRSKAALGR